MKKATLYTLIALCVVGAVWGVLFVSHKRTQNIVSAETPTIRPTYAAVQRTVTADATLRAQRAAVVESEVPLRITSVSVATGDYVTAGQIILRTDIREAAERVAQYEEAVRQAEAAEQRARRHWERLKPEDRTRLVSASEQARSAARAAKIAASKSVLRAPMDGLVVGDVPDIGALARGVLVRIIDPSSLMLEALVPEVDSGEISRGQQVRIVFDALGNQEFFGTIESVEPSVIQRQNSSYVIARIVANGIPHEVLREGLSADVWIVVERRERSLRIPRESAQRRDDGWYVRVRTEDGLFQPQRIEVEMVGDDGIVVRSGLDEDTVIAQRW